MKNIHISFKDCKQYNGNLIISQLQVRMCTSNAVLYLVIVACGISSGMQRILNSDFNKNSN